MLLLQHISWTLLFDSSMHKLLPSTRRTVVPSAAVVGYGLYSVLLTHMHVTAV
jgi:hypothetical protein